MKFIVLITLISGVMMAQGSAFIGLIKPIYDIKLSVAVDASVKKILLKEGDVVKKDQTIIYLNDELQSLETSRRLLIYEDNSKAESLKENLVIMKNLVEAKERLYTKTKAVSLNDLNRLKMQYINLKSEYEIDLESKKRENIEYQIANTVLEYYKIKSPITGIITEIKPSVGERLQTNSEIVRIVNVDVCYVELDIDSNLLDEIDKKKSVVVEVERAGKIIKKKGKIEFVSVIADNASGLVRVKISFDNKDKAVLPGVTAKITF